MVMYKIYYNPLCEKNVAALNYLKSKGVLFQIIQYLKSPFSETELAAVLLKMGKNPDEIVKKDDPFYMKNFADAELSESEWIRTLIKYPKMIESPIIVSKYKAVIGYPLSNIDELFD